MSNENLTLEQEITNMMTLITKEDAIKSLKELVDYIKLCTTDGGVKCYVTVTNTMKKLLEETGLKVGGIHGYPEVYSSTDLAMSFRGGGDCMMVELELNREDIEFYGSGVFLVKKDITPSNVVGFKAI